MKAKKTYVIQYHHIDTDELVYRVCDTLRQAKEWATWTAKQKWVKPGSVAITLEQGGVRI